MKKFMLFIAFLPAIFLLGCSASAESSTGVPTQQTQLTVTFGAVTESLPSPSPSPTPTLQVQVSNAEKLFFYGDYYNARQEFLTVLNSSTDSGFQASALWGLARIEFKEGYFDKSLSHIETLITNHPASPQTKLSFFLKGQCLDALKRYAEAAGAYQDYLENSPGNIDAYVQEILADSLSNAGNITAALSAYQASLSSPRVGDISHIEIKIAKLYSALGNYDENIRVLTELATRTTDEYLLAQIDFLLGQTYLTLGQTDQTQAYFLDAVTKYPQFFDSYSALVWLVEAGVPVNDLDRGLVDYFAKQYGVALAAFSRYLQSNPDHDGTVLNFLALALRENGDYQAAIDAWTVLISNYPQNRYWESAWDERAYTLWAYMDQFDLAANSLLDYVDSFPSSPNSPYALNSAARIQERGGQLELASQTWQRIATEYPASDLVSDALFLSGIQLYRLSKYDRSLVTFQKGMLLSSTPADQARAYFWIGKTQKMLADPNSAQASFQLSASLDLTGYYSERARDSLLEQNIFQPPSTYSFVYDLNKERAEAEAWVRITFNLPPETNLKDSNPLSNEAGLQRGTELWKLGLTDLAWDEFETLRTTMSADPVMSYLLMNYLQELGYYHLSITTCRQLLKLAGLETYTQMLTAPNYFNHINYGTYFQDLVISTAGEFDLHPLLLFSIITQESAFETYITSSMGARGLMQIIPSTGQSLSENLGWPLNYTDADLYRPVVNVRLGSSYLNSNLTLFNQDIFPTLAAYNAGPGNAGIWKGLAGEDPDLFLEVVRYSETRDYIRYIYEIFSVYRSLYGTSP